MFVFTFVSFADAWVVELYLRLTKSDSAEDFEHHDTDLTHMLALKKAPKEVHIPAFQGS